MKKIYCILLIFLSCAAYSKEIIFLEKISAAKTCEKLNSLEVSTNLDTFDQFNIANGDYLILTLSDANLNRCFSFKYYPNITPYMNVYIKNNILKITEIAGSTLNGNLVEKSYAINLKKKSLTEIKSKFVSFDTDEDGKTHRIVSDF